jgi:two-component system, LytTR family, sensor kinase
MKVRWREYELALICFFAMINVYITLAEISLISEKTPLGQAYIATFNSDGSQFDGLMNYILPRLFQYLLILMLYTAIDWSLKLVKTFSIEEYYTKPMPLMNIIGRVYLISVFWALGSNYLTTLAKPYLFNYDRFSVLSLLGFNDSPVFDVTFGVKRAMIIVISLLFYGILRDKIIDQIERPEGKREFRIAVTNNIALLISLYLVPLVFANPIHDEFLMYFAKVTPVLVLYLYTKFWLFPAIKDGERWRKNNVLRLLIVTFVGALPHLHFYIFLDRPSDFWMYWAFLLFIATPVFWLIYQSSKEKILKMKGMEQALVKSKADLQFLRSQINPHFLFNAMNTLYGTALREGSTQTAEGIQKLGDMMRFMLHENNQDFIPMQKEIEYLKNYLDLQKMRIKTTSDLLLEDNIGQQPCEHPIAPMLLIPFVENAFKHGISLQGKSWIIINLICTEKTLTFQVKNSIHPKRENDPEDERSGIGLQNVVERLKLLYLEQHSLDFGAIGNEFIVNLKIQFS